MAILQAFFSTANGPSVRLLRCCTEYCRLCTPYTVGRCMNDVEKTHRQAFSARWPPMLLQFRSSSVKDPECLLLPPEHRSPPHNPKQMHSKDWQQRQDKCLAF